MYDIIIIKTRGTGRSRKKIVVNKLLSHSHKHSATENWKKHNLGKQPTVDRSHIQFM